jgi:hypothetical protein
VQFQLDRDGLTLLSGLLTSDDLGALNEMVVPAGASAGTRIFGNRNLATWLDSGPVGAAVRSILKRDFRAVRAISFDKTPERNWAVGWHQDRTIAVRNAAEEPGFDHWTMKSGVTHVEPPFSIIENMVTARIHIDAVDECNSPLLVSPGSHRLGRIREPDVIPVVRRCGAATCIAERGDVWLYRTSILHASERSRRRARRRVLQVDYASEDLPGELEWVGLA